MERVKTLGKALAIVVLGAALAMGIMYVVFPANQVEGPADPYLSVRRPVLRFLSSVGLAPGADRYLPSVGKGGTTISKRGQDGEDVLLQRTERDSEPVYRGAFWKVGSRVTYRTVQFVEPWSTRRVLRLCYARDGKRFVAGEGTIENGLVDPAGRHAEVRGFVPGRRDGYWIEEVDENGDLHGVCGWGRIDPFFPR